MATIVAHLPQMNLVNLSTAVHRLAKLTANDMKAQAELRQHPALEELLHTIAAAFSCMDASEAQPQSLSNVAWSLATLRLVNRPLVEVVAALAVTNISCFKPFELSTMLWAFAKLGTVESTAWCVRPVFRAAATHIMKQVHHFGFRCLATTAWAFATARQRHARLFRSIAAQMMPMVHAANCQEIANTAWAFGTADFHDDQLFNELAEKALIRLDEFKPQELSNMLWGFATNGFFHEAFYGSSSIAAQRMDLQAQHLANILWAFARVRARHPVTQATTLALLPICTMQLATFKPQEVSSTALAVAKAFGQGEDTERTPVIVQRDPMPNLPMEVIDFFSAVTPWAVPRLRDFSAQSLANTVSAYAMVNVPGATALFAAISNEVLTRFDTLEPMALLHLLKGFSSVPHEVGGAIVQALAAGVARHVDELRPQELQTLSRICVANLGLRRRHDLSGEELRGCCVAMAAGEASSVLTALQPPKAERAPALGAGWPEPPLALRGEVPDLGLDDFSHVFPPQLIPTAGMPPEALSPPPGRPPPKGRGRGSGNGSRGAGPAAMAPPQAHADAWRAAGLPGAAAHLGMPCQGLPGAPLPPRMPPYPLPLWPNTDGELLPLPPMPAWQHEEAALALEPLVAGRDTAALLLPQEAYGLPGSMAAQGPEAEGVQLCGLSGEALWALTPPMTAPMSKFASTRGLPLATVQEMQPSAELGSKDQAAMFDYHRNTIRSRRPAREPVRREAPPSQSARNQAAAAAGHSDMQWKCSVKNSFLHVELDDEHSEDDSRDGGSSQRSSSVPGRFDHEDGWETNDRPAHRREAMPAPTTSPNAAPSRLCSNRHGLY